MRFKQTAYFQCGAVSVAFRIAAGAEATAFGVLQSATTLGAKLAKGLTPIGGLLVSGQTYAPIGASLFFITGSFHNA